MKSLADNQVSERVMTAENTYSISSGSTAHYFGDYDGETAEAAIDAMIRDFGLQNPEHWDRDADKDFGPYCDLIATMRVYVK